MMTKMRLGTFMRLAAWMAIGMLFGSLASAASFTTGRAQATTTASRLFVTTIFFSSQPTDTVAGQPIPTVRVQLQDAHGIAVPNWIVTLTLQGGASGAALEGITEQPADSGGAAVFAGLRIGTPGEGYRLVATAVPPSGGAISPPSAQSDPFKVLAPEPVSPRPPAPQPAPRSRLAALAFLQQPASTAAGQAITPAVVVQLADAGLDPSGRAITLKLRGTTGTALLGGVTATTGDDGLATFDQLSIRRAGTGYRLIASADNAATSESAAFDVSPGPAAKLAFTRQPGNGIEHRALSQQPQVSVEDRYGNRTDSAVPVTLDVASREGLPAGRLSCAGGAPQQTRHGVVSFTSCRLDPAGDGYRLIATSPGLLAARSEPFDIQRPGAGGGLWPVGLLAGGALALLAAGAAGIFLLRQHRLGLQAKRVRATPHPDVGTMELVSAEPAQRHAVRLEPHTDRTEPRLWEEP